MLKICGVVVLYNPEMDISTNISSYLSAVDKLYVIDNSDSYKSNQELFQKEPFNNKIRYIPLNENKGIAFALNLACELAIKDKYDWILTMDQDGKFYENHSNRHVDTLKLDDISNNVAIVAPQYLIKNIPNNFQPGNNFKQIEQVITSGNLLKLSIFKEIGKFREDFFIDEVDFEYCQRIKNNNYIIYQNNNVYLHHQLGNSKLHNCMGFKIKCSHHSYIRRYYVTRNRLYMIKIYPVLKRKYLLRNLVSIGKIILFEADKIRKIKSFFYAVVDYQNNFYGKKKFTY